MSYFFTFLTFITTLITGNLFYPHKVQITTPSSSMVSSSSVSTQSSQSVSSQPTKPAKQSYKPTPVTPPVWINSSSSSQSSSSSSSQLSIQDTDLSDALKKVISELPADYVPSPMYTQPIVESNSFSSSQSSNGAFGRGKYKDFIGAYMN